MRSYDVVYTMRDLNSGTTFQVPDYGLMALPRAEALRWQREMARHDGQRMDDDLPLVQTAVSVQPHKGRVYARGI